MADLTIPLIGLTTLVGYFFSKNGKVQREQKLNRESIETFDKPNGDNIYTSNVVTEANEEILNRSLQNYKDAQKPSDTGFIPPLYNTYSTVGKNPTELGKESLSSKELGELNDINRIGKLVSDLDNGVENMPMFRSTVQNSIQQGSEDKNINLLTGLPYEKDHNNMVPFFGSNTKQNMEGFANSGILDKYTGKTFEFQHKKEVDSFYDKKPENIYGMQSQTDNIKDRYIQSIYKQGEKPIESIYVSAPKAGTFENNIRPEFKDINELRPGNNQKQTYSGVVLPGQMGEVRGVIGKVKKNGPETFYESNPDYYFKGPGSFVAPKVKEDYTINFKTSSRDQYNLEYYGNVNSTNFNKSPQRVGIDNSNELQGNVETFTTADSDLTNSLFQEPKRINYENDYMRNISGSKTVNDYGRSSLKQYTNERSTTEDRFDLGNITVSGKQVVIRPTDDIKTTLKQTTLRTNDSGNVKTMYNMNSTDPYSIGMSDMNPKDTQKQNLIDNKYLGQSTNGQSGLGYLVNKYDAKVTNKEIITNNSNYSGNPQYTNEFGSRQQYDNLVVRDQKQDLLMGQRAGGQQKFQISSGKVSFGEVKTKANLLLKEEIDNRNNMNAMLPQMIPDKHLINIQGNKEEANDNRLQPDLFIKQLGQNPYVINNNK
jgi:hypothetical protein